MKTKLLSLLVLLSPLYAQIKNGSFEEWAHDKRPKHFFTDFAGQLQQTTDAHSGKFAIRLSNYYGYFHTSLTSGSYENPGFTMQGLPLKMRGYYMYQGNKHSCGEALARVSLKRTEKPHLFTTHFVSKLPPTKKYTYFEVDIKNAQSEVPADTLVVSFRTQGRCQKGKVCCFLYLDSLEIVEQK